MNVIVFGSTSKEWRQANPERDKAGENIRDSASINELIVLSNMESKNAELIRAGIDKQSRFEKLLKISKYELELLNSKNLIKSLKKSFEDIYLSESKKKKDW